ncbi:S-adenosylmethionine decarboxylase [Micromonospora sp. B11E3]|uniref:S-adenosylmethionine decarboxylase n=1 Tax=Micromonospora sp. B11E3 TaxID=3153562 RepID=UPI00325CB26A
MIYSSEDAVNHSHPAAALPHQHLIVRAEVESAPSDPDYIKVWLTNIIRGIGMKLAVGPEANPIAYYCEIPGNQGLTGVAILETSHCAIHVWDSASPRLVQFDLYTCSEITVPTVLKFLDEFRPRRIEYKFIDREFTLREVDSSGIIQSPGDH